MKHSECSRANGALPPCAPPPRPDGRPGSPGARRRHPPRGRRPAARRARRRAARRLPRPAAATSRQRSGRRERRPPPPSATRGSGASCAGAATTAGNSRASFARARAEPAKGGGVVPRTGSGTPGSGASSGRIGEAAEHLGIEQGGRQAQRHRFRRTPPTKPPGALPPRQPGNPAARISAAARIGATSSTGGPEAQAAISASPPTPTVSAAAITITLPSPCKSTGVPRRRSDATRCTMRKDRVAASIAHGCFDINLLCTIEQPWEVRGVPWNEAPRHSAFAIWRGV